MKRLLYISLLSALLVGCQNHSNEEHEQHSGLDMSMEIDEDQNNQDIIIELHQDDAAYKADRVRIQLVDQDDEENVSWIDTTEKDNGVYIASLEEVKKGTYEAILHVNGPNDLHDHTEKIIEVK